MVGILLRHFGTGRRGGRVDVDGVVLDSAENWARRLKFWDSVPTLSKGGLSARPLARGHLFMDRSIMITLAAKTRRCSKQRGAALVDTAVLIALVALVSLEALEDLGESTSDRMCNNAAQVYNSDKSIGTARPYRYEKNLNACCSQANSNGSRRIVGSGHICIPSE
jgi:hypothetical protein